MLKIYGSMLCKDCVACVEELKQAGVSFEFLDFADDLANLKEFLALRDTPPAFAEPKAEGKIGIPCIVTPEGDIALDWARFF